MQRLTALLFVCFLGCGGPDAEEGNIVMVEQDDPEMAQAVQQARASLADFTAALQSPSSTQQGFAVKAKFVEGENSEFMWVGGLFFDGQTFHGQLGNEPAYLSNVHEGDRISVPAAEIQDWLYMDGDAMVGGYTVKVLMARQ